MEIVIACEHALCTNDNGVLPSAANHQNQQIYSLSHASRAHAVPPMWLHCVFAFDILSLATTIRENSWHVCAPIKVESAQTTLNSAYRNPYAFKLKTFVVTR